MDIKKLKRLFPNLTILIENKPNYFTFIYQNKRYGIPKNELTDEQMLIIDALTEQLPRQTDEELKWLKFLQDSGQAPKNISTYRLTFIKFNHPIDEPDTFRESIETIMNHDIIFLWHDFTQVTLLEDIKHDEFINFHEIIDVMSDDFDLNMKLFISDIEKDITFAPTLYQWMKTTSPIIWQYSNERITEQKNSIIPMIPHLFKQHDQQIFIQTILKETTDDPELLDTIKNVIECQGNVSLAAKKLYMHRNSVQYRIDKFYELTGNDLRQFNDSLRVYLAILLFEGQ